MNVPIPVVISLTLQQPIIGVIMTVLGFCGWESLKIRDGSKGREIDNIQSHDFDRYDWDKYSFTLDINAIYKPIQ